MTSFLLNLLLAAVWAALVGTVDQARLAFGFVLGYVLLAWLRPFPGADRYAKRLPRAIGLVLFFVWELALSSLRVAQVVLSPRPRVRPGIVGVPLEARTDMEITLLACLITLTPGTLSLDVSPDRETLYVHSMWTDDPDELRRSIKDGFERRVLELLR